MKQIQMYMIRMFSFFTTVARIRADKALVPLLRETMLDRKIMPANNATAKMKNRTKFPFYFSQFEQNVCILSDLLLATL